MAAKVAMMASQRASAGTGEGSTPRPGPLPEPDVAREWLFTMTLIRRFEERAGEMYARAKIGGFLHLSIGEEATIVGSARALRAQDYLISTYRSHGNALARGTPPERVMAELFGRADGCSGGHGGSMHMFDLQRRFMGGYGIVGGNLPIGAGIGLSSDYLGRDEVTLCSFGDGASQPGHVRGNAEPCGAVAPAGGVHGRQQPVRHGHLYRAPLRRDRPASARASRWACRVCAVTGWTCSIPSRSSSEALARVRADRQPLLVEAVTYRFRGHSMADPEEYRTKEEVARWRERDPIPRFGDLLQHEGLLDAPAREQIEREAAERVERAVQFAEDSPFPAAESLYEDVYVIDEQVQGRYHL